MRRGLGWLPDTPDERDRRFAKLGGKVTVPAQFSLKSDVVEVLDQKQTSSCVAHAFAQAMRIADKVAGISEPALTSREFLYFNARAFDGQPIVDEGTQLRSCAKGMIKFGRPPESVWPFRESYINERPPWEAYREAYDYRGPGSYLRVVGLDEIRQAIASGKPVVGGTSVGDSIFDYTDGVYDPDPNEPSVGGHALCVVGYDADSFTLVNSWGISYGEAGFMRVSPSFMATFTDCWSLHDE